MSTSLSYITSRQHIQGVPTGVLRRREGPVCGLRAGTYSHPLSHPTHTDLMSLPVPHPIDFPFHVSLTLLPLHPPEMVTPALLHTSAHTTPGYTLCPCAHSRWSGGGSPLGQEWAEVRGGTGSCPPGGYPYSCSVGPGRSLNMRGAHRQRDTKAFETEGEAGRDAQERVLRKRPQR